MKQIVISRHGSAGEVFQMEEGKTPSPGDSEMLVKVEGFGLNYADVMARKGLYKDAPKPPFVPGYEIVGKVVQGGKKVPKNFLGKRVVAFTRFGGYADHAVSDFRGSAIIEDTVPAAEACALATQYCTAYYMTSYLTSLHQGEIALIHACAGGVGTALVQLCQRMGVTVIGLCGSDEKVAYLEKLGVDLSINYKKSNYSAIIENRFGRRKVDNIFNPVSGGTFKKDLKLLGFGGKIFCYGGSSRHEKGIQIFNDLNFLFKTGFVSPLFMMMKSQSMLGVNMLRVAENKIEVIGKCLDELLKLWANGQVKPTIGAVFKAEDIAEAHKLLESGQSMGKIYAHWRT